MHSVDPYPGLSVGSREIRSFQLSSAARLKKDKGQQPEKRDISGEKGERDEARRVSLEEKQKPGQRTRQHLQALILPKILPLLRVAGSLDTSKPVISSLVRHYRGVKDLVRLTKPLS